MARLCIFMLISSLAFGNVGAESVAEQKIKEDLSKVAK